MRAQSVRELYQRHASALEAHCHRLIGTDEASDAVQETFARVLAHGGARHGEEHALRSLFRISTHVCIDVLRRRDVRRRAVPELLVHARPHPAGAAAYDAREGVERLLERCDATTGAILGLCMLEEQRREDAARALGVTRKTVWSRLRKLEQLAEELALAE